MITRQGFSRIFIGAVLGLTPISCTGWFSTEEGPVESGPNIRSEDSANLAPQPGTSVSALTEELTVQQRVSLSIADLSSPSQTVRRKAARELLAVAGAIDTSTDLQPIIDAFLNKNVQSGITTRIILAETLGKLARKLGPSQNEPVLAPLISVLTRKDFESVRVACARALGRSKSSQGVSALRSVVQEVTNPWLRAEAYDALQQLNSEGLSQVTFDDLNRPSDAAVENHVRKRFVLVGMQNEGGAN